MADMPRQPTVTADGAVEAIREADPPYVTTGDLADHFDVTRQAVRNNRERLRADPRIEMGDISNNAVFFLADEEDDRESGGGDVDDEPAPPDGTPGGLVEALTDRLAVLSGASLSLVGLLALAVAATLFSWGAVTPAIFAFGLAMAGMIVGALLLAVVALARLTPARPLDALLPADTPNGK